MKNPNVFPSEQSINPDGAWNQTLDRGMTLLEYFAGQALTGNIIAYELWTQKELSPHTTEELVKGSYDIAELMLEEREKRMENNNGR